MTLPGPILKEGHQLRKFGRPGCGDVAKQWEKDSRIDSWKARRKLIIRISLAVSAAFLAWTLWLLLALSLDWFRLYGSLTGITVWSGITLAVLLLVLFLLHRYVVSRVEYYSRTRYVVYWMNIRESAGVFSKGRQRPILTAGSVLHLRSAIHR